MSQVHSSTTPAAAHAAPAPQNEVPHDIGDVHMAPADGVHGKVGLYAVTVDGHTRYMNKQDALDLMHALTPSFRTSWRRAPATTSWDWARARSPAWRRSRWSRTATRR